MKALQRTEDDGCYWYPLRPALRWPARIAGVLLTLGLLAEWATTGHLRWQGLFIPLWFISLSFDTPERRPKITSYYLGMAVILGVPILLFAIYSVLGALYPPDQAHHGLSSTGRVPIWGVGVLTLRARWQYGRPSRPAE